ncbi:MAG: AMP-binding acetyl-CoA synthetase [Xanthomonadaceae bacterium]|nr:AMP-binding acetyl-CoA synthetase [Xanthomonadaceae bacterium]
MSAAIDACLPLRRLAYWAQTTPDAVYLTQPLADGTVRTFTWAEVRDTALRIAAHLAAQGWPAGSRIAILSKNSAWWYMADFAIWLAGHVSVPIYPSLTGDSVRYVLEHAEAEAVFVGQLDSSDRAAMLAGIPAGVAVIRLPTAGAALPDGRAAQEWDALVAANAPLPDPADRGPLDVATIIYTSGTTGLPKGVMHHFRAMAVSGYALKLAYNATPDDRVLSYLPLAHVADRVASEMHSLTTGLKVWFSLGLDTFTADLQRARPTFFLSVPRLWTKFRQAINARIPQPQLAAMLADPDQGPGVRQQILTQLGLDAVRVPTFGAAPMPPDLQQWYLDLGLDMLEVYGMTENMAVSHRTSAGAGRIGYVGQPSYQVEARLDPANGELLVKSPGQMIGYYKDAAKTAEAMTDDGFFRTGDVGSIDDDGYFRITGRAKEAFKTAKGKYVAPARIENKLGAHGFVEACCVAGSGFPQPFALLMLSPAAAAKCADASAGRDAVSAALAGLREQVNATLDPHERLDRLIVVPDAWTIDNGMVTPTFKVKRAELEKRYGPQFDDWATRRDAVIWA